MKRLPLIVVAGVALLAGAAPSFAVQRPVKPRLPPMPTILEQNCPGDPDVAGCYDDDADVLYIADRSYRFGLLHELGHVFDAKLLDAGERQRFAQLMHKPDDRWETYWSPEGRPGDAEAWPSSLNEVFGDAYATCRLQYVRESGHYWEAGYNYYPTAAQHRRVCRFIADAAIDAGRPAQRGWR